MDTMKAARKLQQLLILHDRILRQINTLENATQKTSQRLFLRDLDHQTRDVTKKYLRLSVENGVKSILEQCRCRLVARIQKLSLQIIAAIQADDNTGVTQQTTTESAEMPAAMDMAAVQYTSNVQKFFRCE